MAHTGVIIVKNNMSDQQLISKLKTLIIAELILIFALALGFLDQQVLAADPLANDSGDAIGIKVLPNPEHNSPYAWYLRNAPNKGTPTTMVVDGYEAVRDGRTVYINAANVNSETNQLYTNIYVISYNQDPDPGTTDVFGQLLNYWKFNSSLVASTGNGLCLPQKATACDEASPCPGKAVCDNGTCQHYCLLSSECSANQYCDSAKAKLIRDVKRLSDLHEVNLAIKKYASQNNTYPLLEAGTYLPGKTLSTWPSWKETLAKALAINLPVDPVNRLGACDGYDSVTCWNEQNKKFATDFSPNNILPAGSLAYVYQLLKTEKTFQICTNYETNYEGLIEANRCGELVVSDQKSAPEIIFKEDLSQTEGPFKAYFRVNSFYDLKKNGIVIEPVSPSTWQDWDAWDFGSNSGLLYSSTSDPKVKMLSAKSVELAPDKPYDVFSFKVTATDIKGNSASSISRIRICNPKVCAENSCGQMQDNCGSTLVCPACPSDETCDQINHVCRGRVVDEKSAQ